jgi:hypothetical protein
MDIRITAILKTTKAFDDSFKRSEMTSLDIAGVVSRALGHSKKEVEKVFLEKAEKLEFGTVEVLYERKT